ncbi:MAG: HNH endonuclease signature motif containing protein, partial [Marmoricola sp.]
VIADHLMTGELDLTTSEQGDVPAKRRSSLPATLFVHVRVEDLLAHLSGEDRIGRIEKLGPATLDLLAQWLGDTDLRIRPVLDMGRTDAVDAHDPPAWMRELVIQRDKHCAFPGCDRDARSCDLDHVDPYVAMDEGGPPGQTSPANLAPLCRRHHRCKTFTRWRYRRLPSGDYLWTSPDGTTVTSLT